MGYLKARGYHHLTEHDRHYIQVGLKRNRSVRQIAADLGKSYSAVYREIRLGKHMQWIGYGYAEVYTWEYGQLRHDRACAKRGPKLKIGRDHATARNIERKIREGYSPYAACIALKAEGKLHTDISWRTLYRYIYDGVLDVSEDDLRYGHYKIDRKEDFEKRRDMPRTQGKSIEKRPRSVLRRQELGHWEGDLIVSAHPGHAAVFTLVERKTRFLIATLVKDKRQRTIARALDEIEARYGDAFPMLFRSLTLDNGIEFRNTEMLLASALPDRESRFGDVYYAHPYCSSERGSNELANRLVRWEFPKGTNFDEVTQEELDRHIAWLNSYPRKKLGGRSAQQAFEEELSELMG